MNDARTRTTTTRRGSATAAKRASILCAATLIGSLAAGAPVASAQMTGGGAGESYLVVVSGIGGEPQYKESFLAWGRSLVESAVARHGVPKTNVRFLVEQPDAAPGVATGKSTKAELEAVLKDLGGRAGPNDQVTIVLIGHGSYQGGVSAFNLSGPDLTAEDFGVLLSAFRAPVVFANTTSASGEFVRTLAGPNRVVLAATKSGNERNESVFGKHFADAFAGDGSDTDKDGRVSVLEAFEYARLQTLHEYETDSRLLTEHAVLDDNGDGVGESAPGTQKQDGSIAAAMYLGTAAAAMGLPADASPALRALYDTKASLEKRIAELRSRKDSMDAAEYERQLEALLLELAQTNRRIREAGGG